MTSFGYGGIGDQFTVRVSIEELSVSDRRELLWKLLVLFDPGMNGARYEEYQEAAKVVLEVADKK